MCFQTLILVLFILLTLTYFKLYVITHYPTLSIMEKLIYQQFDSAALYCLYWMLPFIALTVCKVLIPKLRPHKQTLIDGELPSIPLVLLHSYLFVLSLIYFDPYSAVLFAWWGPGFLYVAAIVLSKRPCNWKKYAAFTSVACKINYVLIVGVLFYYEAYIAIYAYSVWIIQDQIKLNWFHLNADRSRRTLEDFWLFRLCYPGFLLLPFFINAFPHGYYFHALSSILLALWGCGLARCIFKQHFYQLPTSYTENLRDIVYLNNSDDDKLQEQKHGMA